MAKEWCRSHGDANFGLRLLSDRTTTRQYNAPTVSEVSALIINDFGDALPTRDIVVNKNNTGPQRILELHQSYMALQYPLLFPFGEDGYHENIPYHINEGIRKTKRGYYLVDAFTAIEEQRLNWTQNKQDTFHVDLYHNLYDDVTRGDTSAARLGKRIVLPRTYIGSLRYMMHNYQDAMALCRTYGNLDLFITFTSNLKWPEIAEMLAYIPGQKSHDRPEHPIVTFPLRPDFGVVTVKAGANELNYHVPEQNEITLGDSVDLPALLERKGISITMFTEWFELNKKYLKAREYTYAEIPQHYVWHAKDKSARSFTELKMVNKINYATFKAACFAYGLLNDDKEWTHTIAEASFWAMAPQLRDLFVTILYPKLNLSDEQVRNYCLLEIQDLLNTHGKSLTDFRDLPQPNPKLLINLDNHLLREALAFDANKRKVEQEKLHSMLNPEQRLIYEQIIESVNNDIG
ncbi:ATP-dependent DNA helicase PIF1-like protein [Tanacetum coccineum]